MHAIRAGNGGPIEVLPLVVVARAFPARPSSLPGIRDFVRQRLGHTGFTEDDIRALGDRLLDTLLDVAGPTGMIQLSVRIFPDHAEVDVLPGILTDQIVAPVAGNGNGNGRACVTGTGVNGNGAGRGGAGGDGGTGASGNGNGAGGNGATNGRAVNGHGGDPLPAASFAEWFAGALRREGMTMEAVARRIQVSVKTVSRWVGGTTEPRLRDLSRIREIFGELPFP
jgi:hypothetical protein